MILPFFVLKLRLRNVVPESVFASTLRFALNQKSLNCDVQLTFQLLEKSTRSPAHTHMHALTYKWCWHAHTNVLCQIGKSVFANFFIIWYHFISHALYYVVYKRSIRIVWVARAFSVLTTHTGKKWNKKQKQRIFSVAFSFTRASALSIAQTSNKMLEQNLRISLFLFVCLC